MKLKSVLLIAAVAAVPLLTPSVANAIQFLPGTNCMPITMTQAPDIFFSKDGVTNQGTRDLWVTCPWPFIDTDLSNMSLYGTSPQSGISCIFRLVHNDHTWLQRGFNINTALAAPTGGFAGSVSPSLNVSAAVAPLGFGALFVFSGMSVACKLPPSQTLEGLFTLD